MLLDITEGHTGLKNNIKARKHDRLLISSWALRIQHRVANVETILHITWPVMPVMMATFLFVLSSPFTSPLAAAAAHWAIFWSWFRFGVSVGSGYTVRDRLSLTDANTIRNSSCLSDTSGTCTQQPITEQSASDVRTTEQRGEKSWWVGV